MSDDTREGNAALLAEYAELMNRYGPDSSECMAWVYRNRHNQEVIELSRIAYCLKKGLTTDRN